MHSPQPTAAQRRLEQFHQQGAAIYLEAVSPRLPAKPKSQQRQHNKNAKSIDTRTEEQKQIDSALAAQFAQRANDILNEYLHRKPSRAIDRMQSLQLQQQRSNDSTPQQQRTVSRHQSPTKQPKQSVYQSYQSFSEDRSNSSEQNDASESANDQSHSDEEESFASFADDSSVQYVDVANTLTDIMAEDESESESEQDESSAESTSPLAPQMKHATQSNSTSGDERRRSSLLHFTSPKRKSSAISPDPQPNDDQQQQQQQQSPPDHRSFSASPPQHQSAFDALASIPESETSPTATTTKAASIFSPGGSAHTLTRQTRSHDRQQWHSLKQAARQRKKQRISVATTNSGGAIQSPTQELGSPATLNRSSSAASIASSIASCASFAEAYMDSSDQPRTRPSFMLSPPGSRSIAAQERNTYLDCLIEPLIRDAAQCGLTQHGIEQITRELNDKLLHSAIVLRPHQHTRTASLRAVHAASDPQLHEAIVALSILIARQIRRHMKIDSVLQRGVRRAVTQAFASASSNFSAANATSGTTKQSHYFNQPLASLISKAALQSLIDDVHHLLLDEFTHVQQAKQSHTTYARDMAQIDERVRSQMAQIEMQGADQRKHLYAYQCLQWKSVLQQRRRRYMGQTQADSQDAADDEQHSLLSRDHSGASTQRSTAAVCGSEDGLSVQDAEDEFLDLGTLKAPSAQGLTPSSARSGAEEQQDDNSNDSSEEDHSYHASAYSSPRHLDVNAAVTMTTSTASSPLSPIAESLDESKLLQRADNQALLRRFAQRELPAFRPVTPMTASLSLTSPVADKTYSEIASRIIRDEDQNDTHKSNKSKKRNARMDLYGDGLCNSNGSTIDANGNANDSDRDSDDDPFEKFTQLPTGRRGRRQEQQHANDATNAAPMSSSFGAVSVEDDVDGDDAAEFDSAFTSTTPHAASSLATSGSNSHNATNTATASSGQSSAGTTSGAASHRQTPSVPPPSMLQSAEPSNRASPRHAEDRTTSSNNSERERVMSPDTLDMPFKPIAVLPAVIQSPHLGASPRRSSIRSPSSLHNSSSASASHSLSASSGGTQHKKTVSFSALEQVLNGQSIAVQAIDASQHEPSTRSERIKHQTNTIAASALKSSLHKPSAGCTAAAEAAIAADSNVSTSPDSSVDDASAALDFLQLSQQTLSRLNDAFESEQRAHEAMMSQFAADAGDARLTSSSRLEESGVQDFTRGLQLPHRSQQQQSVSPDRRSITTSSSSRSWHEDERKSASSPLMFEFAAHMTRLGITLPSAFRPRD